MSRETGPEQDRQIEPRIYVASLSDYTAGILHGTWLDAADEPTALWDGINQMLAASPTTARYGDPAEEWAIHDYEGFGSVALGEWERIEDVATLARGIVAHGRAFAAWWGNEPRSNNDDGDVVGQFEEAYLGEYGSVTDYAEHYLDEIGIDPDEIPGVPEQLRPYVRIDTDALARDMVAEGAIWTAESTGGVHVFAE